MQDALVRAFRLPLRTPEPSEAEAYVRVIITNRFIDLVRRKAPRRRATGLLDHRANVPDPAEGVALQVDLASALCRLTPKQRVCVVLYYYQDLSTPQVARVLHCAEGTVKRHLHDARMLLHGLLSDTDIDDESGKDHADF